VADEIGEGGLFAIFFPHEQKGNIRRQENDPGGQLEPFEGGRAADPLPKQAVPNLVVILGENPRWVAGISREELPWGGFRKEEYLPSYTNPFDRAAIRSFTLPKSW
jgi:hypothetical protein